MAISKITLNGVTQMDVTQKTVTAGSMLSGTTALKNDGTDIVGNIASKSSSDLTNSIGSDNRLTVTAPAGNYSSNATKTIQAASVTVGLNKSTVSNHQTTVSATKGLSSGYLNSTNQITTDSVTVSASELVSGTKSITSSGTTDVTNYASASVAAGSATAPASISGTSASVSTGTNTLTLSKTISVTPSVTAGYISSGTAGNTSVSLTASVNTRSSSDLTASGATVTAPAGYYDSAASKSVESMTLPTSSAGSAASGYVEAAVISSGNSDQYINIPPGFNTTGAYYKINSVNYESVYITDGVGGDYSGVTIVKESANSFKMYGTATATRRLLILNGQNSVATSSTAFSQTIDSGFYIAETSISGYYADAIVWTYTYSTFANGETLCSRSKPQTRVYLENPAMIGLIIGSGSNYGTSDNPTYITISVKRWSGQSYGMEYEEGTWTPASDTSSYTISFTNTHTTAPFFYMITDTGGYYSTTYSNHNLAVWSPYLLTGVPLYYSSNSAYYALGAYRYRGTSTTSLTNGSTTVSYESYISDYMTNTGITASVLSASSYWRAGRTYKWIAVWAPTT